MKRKIAVTTGTRAEYGILRPILQAISSSRKLELFLIVTGTHLSKKYGLTINEIKKDGFKIYAKIDNMPKIDSNYFMATSLGKGIIAFSKIFYKLQPDINLILGDRDEMLASAIAAYHMNIPNAHIHGGDRSQGGIDEYNRHAITKMSNIHFAATKKSYQRIIKMGENPKNVFLTGSPNIDAIMDEDITSKQLLEKKYPFAFNGNEILLLQHPVTTETELSKLQISATLDAIVKIKRPTIAIAPNSDAGNRAIFENLRLYSQKYEFINVYPTVPRNDYLGMIKYCGVLIGNSSSGVIEASYFNTPVVNIGIRQKGREKGNNVTDVPDGNVDSIYRAILRALQMRKRKFINSYIYGRGKASKKIVLCLEKINLNKNLIQKQIFY
ncbi:MAG: UDP-N-acetylglucosamine 2-epimerase (hydrolyzing) [Thaumarchaeota archaeon]|nr:UDP-N-acetylglucosamine 2-epimerase (hydrolyzing) [Nitrososphaerota archaeon]